MTTFTSGVSSPSPPRPATVLPCPRRESALRAGAAATARLHEHSEREAREWSTLVRRLSLEGRPGEALALFREMSLRGSDRCVHPPDGVSLSAALRCCSALGAVKSGREVHAVVVRNAERLAGLQHVESSLVNFYATCGLLVEARRLFDGMPERDVVTWTIMLMGYADCDGLEAKLSELFEQMLCSGIEPNPHTFTTVLRRVSLDWGRQLHCHIAKMSLDLDAFVGNALLDMYVKNGDLDCAWRIFRRIQDKDVVCFNTLISGYGRTGDADGLVSVLQDMGMAGFAANQATHVGLINGCASLGLMSLSAQVHAHAIVNGFGSDAIVRGALLDMYAKCGDLDAARAIFNELGTESRTLVTWNSMIGAYGKHGRGQEALQVFRLMEMAGIRPDYITFTCLLSACSHSGLVDEGWRLFKLMGQFYMIPPRNEHYCCMVDLMGRAGMIPEAYEFIINMDCEVGPSVWGSLLNSCRLWGDAEIAEIAAKWLFELEPDCSGSYVALASIYAADGRWDDADVIRGLMETQGIKKKAGCSWTEVESDVYNFRAGKTNDHQSIVGMNSTCNRLDQCLSNPAPLETS
ncbi:hypothetical protein Taro_044534 [Colocasia esculenta]|uniref:Pentatricopeptide repeat-containing protein n=1 Tax=Colocasia esculenta TaxID=4460 RepID=A0A843WJF1_COLES|nr:hypothetical protein [Colocasia esculenta]